MGPVPTDEAHEISTHSPLPIPNSTWQTLIPNFLQNQNFLFLRPSIPRLRNLMGKKSKQPSAPSSAEISAEPPSLGSNSVFDKLFGDVPKGGDSIFAEDNPFRRRKDEALPQERQVQPNVSAEDGKLEVKAKRKKDDLSAEEPSRGSIERKMLKRVKVDGEDGEREGEGERKKKKKRKRDELEKKYEERVYGAVEEGEKVVVGKKRKKVDDSAATMVEKEDTFDDESKLVRTVFVGNLPLKMKKKTLLKEFNQFGEIESVRIRSVPIIDVGIMLLTML